MDGCTSCTCVGGEEGLREVLCKKSKKWQERGKGEEREGEERKEREREGRARGREGQRMEIIHCIDIVLS